jgi:hypothetical protein
MMEATMETIESLKIQSIAAWKSVIERYARLQNDERARQSSFTINTITAANYLVFEMTYPLKILQRFAQLTMVSFARI